VNGPPTGMGYGLHIGAIAVLNLAAVLASGPAAIGLNRFALEVGRFGLGRDLCAACRQQIGPRRRL